MNELDLLLSRIDEKKAQLDALRPLHPETEKSLYEWFRIKLTYTSNAIEGNTLSEVETAEVVEKGYTVPGKKIVELLEAINHAEAVDLVKKIATVKKTRDQLTITDILDIHACILDKINDTWAGRFRAVNVRIHGSPRTCPNYMKVPELMDEFMQWLQQSTGHPATIAADTHLKFVEIHPFVDGNGRTGRLLLNLILLQQNFPITFIKVEDRRRYIDSIQEAFGTGNLVPYYQIIYEAIERSLDEYLKDAR